MQEFIHRMNIAHYRKLLAGELDEAKRELISKLLAEEEKKEAGEPCSPPDEL